MQPKITREGEIIKFSNCPPKWEINVDELRRKIRKFQEIKADSEQAKVFVEFYNNIINEKDKQYVAWMFEIFKNIRTRSVRFVPPVQKDDYNIGKPSYMKFCLKDYFYKSKGKPFAFFASTYHIRHTTEGTSLDTKNQLNEPYKFDLPIDIDSPNLEDALSKAWKIIEFVEGISPIEQVDFSGAKGFHPWIHYDALINYWGVEKKDSYSPKEITKIYNEINNKISKGTGIKDMGHINKDYQQIRVPYSIHDKTNLVVLPLTKKQLEKFNLDMVKIENVYKMELRNRGTNIFG